MHKFTDNTEQQRLKALRDYNITETNVDFDFIIESLAAICDVPLCTIVAAYKDNLIIIATTGVKLEKQHRREGSCTDFTLRKNAFCEIEDIKKQEGIDDKTYLVEGFDIIFYAGCPLVDSFGNNLGTLNIYDDKPRTLTDQQRYFIKKAAERVVMLFLQKRQEQRLLVFDNMFSKSKDIIGIVRFNGEIIKVNPAFSKLLGYTDEEIYSKKMIEFTKPDYIKEGKNNLNRITSSRKAINTILPALTKSNKVKWIDWTSTPEPSTELIYFIGRDITAAQEQSDLLKNSEERFRSFFENSQSFMCMHDLNGKLTAVNRSAAAVIGAPAEKFIGRCLSEFLPISRRKLFDKYLETLKEEGSANGITHINGKDGKENVWMYNSNVERNAGGEIYVLGNASDLTERYQIEEELKIATKNAEEANRAKSEFIANMSHEIRTPLNGIIGFTDLVLKTPLDETQQQYLKIINQSGTTLLNIVDQILDFSKIESRRIVLVEDKVDLQNIASDACAMVSYASEKKGLEMLLDLKEDLPRYIWADEVRLKQVLVNLLGNAVKFTEQGEVKLSISLKEELPNDNVLLHFQVSDTGIGISKDKINQIFRAFTQEDGSITKKYGGTGLGLTISNKLLELKDSKLVVESELGKGSTFSFDLIFKAERDSFDDDLLKDIKKILVVDDNDSNRQILKRMLELKDIEVDEADSGLAALLMLQESAEYDIIIMDYHMPVMDGIETIRKIKEIVKRNMLQPIVMLYSSSDDVKLQAACDELDVKSRLVKPIKMQEMYHVLAKLKNENLKEAKKSENKESPTINMEDACKYSSKVLIVEDNEINLYLSKILVQQIAPNGEILEAKDGLEAVSLFLSERPDIILMDIQMPNMNGIDATKEIRRLETNSEVPIIALTAGNMAGENERCLESGMNDFMAKPLIKENLSKMFQKWLPSCNNTKRNKYECSNDIEHINESWFNQYSSDDKEFKGKFISLAKTGIQECVKRLKDAINENDLEAIKATGHKLKGTSLAVGLTQLSKLAVAFELLDEFDKEYINDLMKSLTMEVEIVNNILNGE